MEKSDRFNVYLSFKSVLQPEQYLRKLNIKCFRDTMVRSRLGVSDINTHKYRYHSEYQSLKYCPFCPTETETEHHLLFYCTAYDHIRPKVLQLNRNDEANTKFIRIMSTDNDAILRQIAWFLVKSFQIRKENICL